MIRQGHSGAYGTALDTAMEELDFICEKLERLRNRVTQLDTLAEVLKPLIGSGEQLVADNRRPAFDLIEPARDPVQTNEPSFRLAEIELPELVPQKSESADPIQGRIDSILGMAVA